MGKQKRGGEESALTQSSMEGEDLIRNMIQKMKLFNPVPMISLVSFSMKEL